MEGVDERNRIAQQVFESQIELIKDVGQELKTLKESYTKQSNQFVGEVRNLDNSIIGHARRLTDYCQKLEKISDSRHKAFEIVDSNVQ